MKILYCGFNGFGQWPKDDYLINNFTAWNIESVSANPDKENGIVVCSEWAYNVIKNDSYITIYGFINNELNKSESVLHPNGTRFTNLACNDKHILFYNTGEKYVWKYYLDPDIEEKWKCLPDFLNVERDALEDMSSFDGDTVCKIVCGILMNVALTKEGRVFNIPCRISTDHCLGKVIDISCGHEHVMLLTDQGNVYTFGGGSRCQLGHGSIDSSDEPTLVEALAGIKIVKISAGGWHCCAISVFGDLYTWGWNDRGQLGISSNCRPSETSNNIDEIQDVNMELQNDIKDQNDAFSIDTTSDSFNLNRPNSTKDKAKLDKIVNPLFIDLENGSKDTNFIKFDGNKLVSSNHKRKNNDTEGNSDEAQINYAIPKLVNFYDSSNEEVLELNIVQVSCGSKHTVIKMDDGSIWGSGCNKYGQLGFDEKKHDTISSFVKLKVNEDSGNVQCGIWSTIIMTDCKTSERSEIPLE